MKKIYSIAAMIACVTTAMAQPAATAEKTDSVNKNKPVFTVIKAVSYTHLTLPTKA